MQKKKIVIYFAIISIGFFGRISFASAATYYVSSSGTALWTQCTDISAPCAVQTALSNAVAGDTVYWLDGVYTDSSSTWEQAFNPSNSGTPGNPIIFKSYNPQGAVITGRNRQVMAFGINNKNHITIDGFYVDGQLGAYGNSSYIDIKNNEVVGGAIQGTDTSLNWGIIFNGSITNSVISNNYVHDMLYSGNQTHNTAGIMILAGPSGSSQYNIIEYNTVDATNVGDAYGQKGGNINYNIWRYNFAINAIWGFLGMGSTNNAYYSTNNEFYQNIIINSDYAFYDDHNCNNNKIYNNSAYNVDEFYHSGSYGNPENNTNEQLWNNLSYGTNIKRAYFRAGGTVATPVTTVLDYSDYNNHYNYINWYYREKSPTQNYNLSTFQSNEGFDANSSILIPNYVNPGGVAPIDYKRISYPNNGRGGNYASVSGAYITGDEIIGYNLNIAPDTTPPSSPTGIMVN